VPHVFGSVSNLARAVIGAYDAVTVQLLLDNDLVAARKWLAELVTALTRK
jgi:hypothetical protein